MGSCEPSICSGHGPGKTWQEKGNGGILHRGGASGSEKEEGVLQWLIIRAAWLARLVIPAFPPVSVLHTGFFGAWRKIGPTGVSLGGSGQEKPDPRIAPTQVRTPGVRGKRGKKTRTHRH